MGEKKKITVRIDEDIWALVRPKAIEEYGRTSHGAIGDVVGKAIKKYCRK